MNTNNSAVSTFPDVWYDLWKLDQPLDLEAFLQSDLLAVRRNEMKTKTIIFRTTGSISVIASMFLAIHILRSHAGLSTTYHRLVFGLSVADILSSSAMALSSTMVPKEMNYFVPYAQGNITTCTTQGFLMAVGYLIAGAYNCSICFYYFAIIRYNKKDEYIRTKLEPWFHGISIVCPLVFLGIIGLVVNAYNALGGICQFYQNYPPHCIGYEIGDTPEGFSIPCGRGDEGNNPILLYSTYIVLFLFGVLMPIVVIVGTMLLMYRSVVKIEKKMQRYGVRSLRLSIRIQEGIVPGGMQNYDVNSMRHLSVRTPEGNRDVQNYKNVNSPLRRLSARRPPAGPHRNENADANSIANANGTVKDRIKRLIMCTIPCLRRDDQPTPRFNRATSRKKRAILKMAIGYALAWSFVFIPYIMDTLLRRYYAGEILFACLTPLQGLYNFLVFLSPKVRSAKRSKRNKLTWGQAFIKAYMSKGERRRTEGNTRINSNRGNLSLQQRFRNSLKSLSLTRRMNKKSPNASSRNNQINSEDSTSVAAGRSPSPDHPSDHLKSDEAQTMRNEIVPDEEENYKETKASDDDNHDISFLP